MSSSVWLVCALRAKILLSDRLSVKSVRQIRGTSQSLSFHPASFPITRAPLLHIASCLKGLSSKYTELPWMFSLFLSIYRWTLVTTDRYRRPAPPLSSFILTLDSFLLSPSCRCLIKSPFSPSGSQSLLFCHRFPKTIDKVA